MSGDDFLKALACYVALREANTLQEQVAVLFVLRNRAAGMDGFEPGWHKTLANMLGWTTTFDVRDPDVQQLLQIADTIYDGTRADNLTNGGVFFGGANCLALGDLEQKAVVGTTTFWGKKNGP